MGCALVDASRSSIRYMLQQGISVAVVVGGAQEALDARPGTADLTLGRRLGFIRLAIENGASLIPVFSFGENDVFEPMIYIAPGSWGRKLQDTLKGYMGFSLPIVSGRGLNPLLPKRRPITTIIGKPIPVQKIAKPRLRDILSVHQQYVTALQSIYDEYKDVLDPNRKEELRLVDQLKDRDLRKFVASKETLESFSSKKRAKL
jgi:2-acylglycerol O-acyltransferase 2